MRHEARKSTLNWSSALWIAGALGIVLFAAVLTGLSPRFGYDWDVIDMPVPTLIALLMTAGVIYFFGAAIASRNKFSTPFGNTKIALAVMITAGVVARLILFASEPALEDDYQRYLWDGAVAANGYNPYAVAPEEVIDAGAAHRLSSIAKLSGLVLERVNHPELTTIYPPLTQAAFALAHAIKPLSLASWRAIVFVADIATLGLIIALLGLAARSPLWAAIYWWNPVVLKELFNSAHMDGLVLPFVLGALYLSLKARPVSATTALACAVGIKIWPILLLPLVWRSAITQRAQLIVSGIVFLCFCAVWALPYLSAGLSETSGIVAYANSWTINSPVFTSLRAFFRFIFATASDPDPLASRATRLILAGSVALLALHTARKPIADGKDLTTRALVVVAAVVLLSPAIFPWYVVWMLPLLALNPVLGLVLVSATIPLYYSLFYFAARGSGEIYQSTIVWFVWVPVWLLCAKGLLLRYWTTRDSVVES